MAWILSLRDLLACLLVRTAPRSILPSFLLLHHTSRTFSIALCFSIDGEEASDSRRYLTVQSCTTVSETEVWSVADRSFSPGYSRHSSRGGFSTCTPLRLESCFACQKRRDLVQLLCELLPRQDDTAHLQRLLQTSGSSSSRVDRGFVDRPCKVKFGLTLIIVPVCPCPLDPSNATSQHRQQ